MTPPSSNEIGSIFLNILRASRVLKEVVHKTPLDRSRFFSSASGGDVYLKLENLQKTGAFKVRGAYYKIYMLSPDEKKRGVVAASAGNHAQGVAFASRAAGVDAVIVMPETAPIAKIEATRSYGARIILYGDLYDDAYEKALEIARSEGRVFIHPFDDPYVIAGQGTIALEIIESLPSFDTIIVPVGGGGLISGIAIAVRMLLGDQVKIIGVEAERSPSMKISLEQGHPTEVSVAHSIADGIVVKKPGELTYSIISELVDDIVTVSDDEIAHAIVALLERGKTLAEGAGAVSLAAILSGKVDIANKKCVAIVSGGNIDLSLLSRIIPRELYKMGRLVRISGIVPDKPGVLNSVLQVASRAKANIVDIRHERLDPRLHPAVAEVVLTMEIPQPEVVDEIVAELARKGLEFRVES